VIDVPLRNPGFELPAVDAQGRLVGWYFVQHAGPKSYLFDLDDAIATEGRRSVRITNIGREPYGLVAQRLEITAHRGRRLRFSGMLRTRDIEGKGAGLSIRIEQGGTLLSHDFMLDRLVRGTRDWEHVSIEMPIDATATHLEIGIMLQGSGTVWFDEPRLAILR
jgi:hypothetical protein